MSLLKRFQAGCELESVGEFSLDESKAREKMARFQLVTTEEFLMLAIQAVVAAQASAIELTAEGARLHLVAKQAHLHPDAVRGIKEFIFDSLPENVAYRLLAVAANAVETSCLASPLLAMVDDDLHFEVQLSAAISNLSALLDERLAYLPCPLTFNGEVRTPDSLQGHARVGLLDAPNSMITLVRYGVTVGLQQPAFSINFKAVAPADMLLLDASFSRVVEDDAYEALIAVLRRTANRQLAELAKNHVAGEPGAEMLLDHLTKNHSEPAGTALADCLLFPLADRSEYASLSQLRFQGLEGKLGTSSRRFNLQLDMPVVLIIDRAVSKALAELIPKSNLEDAEIAYRDRLQVEQRKQKWASSPRPTALPPGRYLGQDEVEGVTWEAAIGYLAAPGGPSRVDVLYQGKLLANETLDGLPPGAAAVLNVRQSKVDPTWSHLEGREYRTVLKELKAKLGQLFKELLLTDQSELYPALSDYLIKDLSSKNPTAPARMVPLFPTVSGEVLSLNQVAKLKQIAFGEPMTFTERIPATLLPNPLLLYRLDSWQALSARLGSERLSDLRGLQRRLQTIDQEMTNPAPAELPDGTYLVKRFFQMGSYRGEMGLVEHSSSPLEACLLREGVVFENPVLAGGKVLKAVAVVEAAGLTPTQDWTGFEQNAEYQALVSSLQSQAIMAERELIVDPTVPPEVCLRLLRAYPQDRAVYWRFPLFRTTASTDVSLADLEAEIGRHGHLLRGEVGIAVPERLTLRDPSKDVINFLKDNLGEIVWEEASTVLRQLHEARAFQSKPVVREIALAGAYPVRVRFSGGRGEVALRGPGNGAAQSGEVLCYVQGRFICAKSGLIGADFVASIESDAFVLSRDFQRVTVPDELRQALREHCGVCMLEAARQPGLRERAWEYFRSSECLPHQREQFMAQTEVPLLDGTRKSLTTLAAGRISGYVRPEFPGTLAGGVVLRVSDEQARKIGGLLDKRLANLEPELLEKESLRQALAAIPTGLSEKLFQREFQADRLKAVIGVCAVRRTVGVDDDGQAVGYLRELALPVQVVVYGAHPKKAQSVKLPLAEISAGVYGQLARWSEQLCLEWVKSSAQTFRAQDRPLIMAILLSTMREIGSSATRPTAKIATFLWELPLFDRVDGTRVSGAALAVSLSETEDPILVAQRAFRAPGSALLIEEKSEAWDVLISVLGKDSLRWYEASPLIDSAQLKQSVKRLVGWGLAPVKETWSKALRLLEGSDEPPPAPAPPVKTREPAKKAPVVKFKPKAKKKEAPPKKRDPGEVLVVQLKEDIRNLLGLEHYRKSNELFRDLTFGVWPLGPPVYRWRDQGAYRLNTLHPAIRWLLSEQGDQRSKRAARVLLVVHWVGLVNVASDELEDAHEDDFLLRLTDRMTQTFS